MRLTRNHSIFSFNHTPSPSPILPACASKQHKNYNIEVDGSYGIKALPSYDDQNALFRDARSKQEYVLKIHNLNANCQSVAILDAQVRWREPKKNKVKGCMLVWSLVSEMAKRQARSPSVERCDDALGKARDSRTPGRAQHCEEEPTDEQHGDVGNKQFRRFY